MAEAKKTKVKLTRSAEDIAARRKSDSESCRMISPAPSAKPSARDRAAEISSQGFNIIDNDGTVKYCGH